MLSAENARTGEVPEWLRKWVDKEGRHRTIFDGTTIVCPKNDKIQSGFSLRQLQGIKNCPLCQTELGEYRQEGQGLNISWEH